MGLLVEIDGAAKLGVQHDLELFHPPFALFCGGGQAGELGRNVGLILFESFEGSGLRQMEEGFADFVSGCEMGMKLTGEETEKRTVRPDLRP